MEGVSTEGAEISKFETCRVDDNSMVACSYLRA